MIQYSITPFYFYAVLGLCFCVGPFSHLVFGLVIVVTSFVGSLVVACGLQSTGSIDMAWAQSPHSAESSQFKD